MEPIEVTTRFDVQGKISPVDFTWQERTYPVDSIGRRWQDDNGQHILVMVPGDVVFELVFVTAETRWYLRRLGLNQATV